MPGAAKFQERSAEEALLAAARELPEGACSELSSALVLDAAQGPFSHVRVLSRVGASARIQLLRPFDTGCGRSKEENYEVRWGQCCLHEVVACATLRLLNSVWADAGVHLDGQPVAAARCDARPLGAYGWLTKCAAHSVSLAQLKRTFIGGNKFERVTNHLNHDPKKLQRLARTTAAYLAASYLMGVAAGDGDDLWLTDEGELYRIDFGSLFGAPDRIAAAAPAEATLVWLPRAVTAALGARWPEVQAVALRAFEVAAAAFWPALPSSASSSAWFKAQSALFWLEHSFDLQVTRYVCSLSAARFVAALQAADSNLSKSLTNFLHDNFGVRNKRCGYRAALPESQKLSLKGGVLELWFGDSAPGIDRLVWALGTNVWYLAMCVLSCLCSSRQGCVRFLRRLLCRCLLVAEGDDAAALQSHVVKLIVKMSQHQTGDAQQWLGRALALQGHRDCLLNVISGLRRSGAEMEASSDDLGAAVLGGDAFLEFGSVCAVARMALATDLQSVDEMPWGDVAPCVAYEGQIVRSSAMYAVVLLLKVEGRGFAAALEALARHFPAEQMAPAVRELPANDRFEAIRAMERLATEVNTNPKLRVWAQRSLTTLAQDVDKDVSRAAVCAIACAVQGDCEEVRTWARGVLSSAATGPLLRSPLYALARTALLGAPAARTE